MPVLNDITVKRARPRASKYEITCDAVRGFVLRVLPSGRKIYFVRHRPDGRDVRVRLGSAERMSCNEARAKAVELLEGISAAPSTTRAEPPRPSPRARACPTLSAFAERYDRDHIRQGVKPSSAKRYRYQLRLHLLPALGGVPVDQITPADVERLHAAMSTTPVTANNMIRLLSHMYTKAIDWQVVPRDHARPTRTVRFYRERSRERFLTPEERARLERVLRQAETVPTGRSGSFAWNTVAAIRLLALTGMRRSEVLSLQWSMVDARHRCLRLPDSKTGQRVVPVSSHAIALLDELRRRRRLDILWVIHTQTGLPVDGATLTRSWRRVRKLAGLHDVRLHDLRHSAASDALMAGVSLEVVAKILGHSSTRMTARYAHLSDRVLRDAVESMGESIVAAQSTSPEVDGHAHAE